MKKFLALLFVFVLAVSCVACKSSEIDVPRDVDMTIRQAYIDTHGMSGQYSEPWELGVTYYGYYDGAYVFDPVNNGMDGVEPPWVMGPYRTRIGGLVFHFSQNQSLKVYKDGEFKGLKAAYKAGWLSDEALADLHKSFDGETKLFRELYLSNGKERMVNMKRALAIILLVVITLSCAACDSEKPQVTGEITEELEWVIKMAYLDTFENDKAIKPRHLSLRHYGCYDGAYVLFVDGLYSHMTMMRTEEIGGRSFLFPSSQELYVFKDGQIDVLPNAYSAGWLSDEALAELHKSFSE